MANFNINSSVSAIDKQIASTKRNGLIEEVLQAMAKEIETLHAHIDTLTQRIAPILSSEILATSMENDDRKCLLGAPLAMRLTEYNLELERIGYSLAQLTNRVAL